MHILTLEPVTKVGYLKGKALGTITLKKQKARAVCQGEVRKASRVKWRPQESLHYFAGAH